MEKKGKVLVIDDDQMTRNMIKTYLGIMGFEVETAEDGLDGYNKLKAGSGYKLIFSDFEMPNMNGLQFLEKVKKENIHQNTPVVMLTSVDKQDIIDKAKGLGATAYMTKPFTNQKMHDVLTALKFNV